MYIRTIPASYKGDFSWDEMNLCFGKIQREFDYLTSSNVIPNERSVVQNSDFTIVCVFAYLCLFA